MKPLSDKDQEISQGPSRTFWVRRRVNKRNIAVLLSHLVEETILKLSQRGNFPSKRKSLGRIRIIRILNFTVYLLDQKEAMLAGVDTVPPSSYPVNKCRALLGVEPFGWTGSLPRRIRVQSRESEPVRKLVLF